MAGLRRVADFDISVAAYPEVHPEAASPQADLDHLKRKLDAGAARAITQYAFDTDGVLRFIDRARAAGIDAPIVPGIMPVANFASLKRFSANCGATIPDWLEAMFDGLDDTPEIRNMVAANVAIEQCRRLITGGVEALHIYTLNHAGCEPGDLPGARDDARDPRRDGCMRTGHMTSTDTIRPMSQSASSSSMAPWAR